MQVGGGGAYLLISRILMKKSTTCQLWEMFVSHHLDTSALLVDCQEMSKSTCRAEIKRRKSNLKIGRSSKVNILQ